MASRRVLDGIVPVFRHTPPIMSLRSTIATRRSSFAAAMAAFWPPGPEPSTSTSKSYTRSSVTTASRLLNPWRRPTLLFTPQQRPGPPVRANGQTRAGMFILLLSGKVGLANRMAARERPWLGLRQTAISSPHSTNGPDLVLLAAHAAGDARRVAGGWSWVWAPSRP